MDCTENQRKPELKMGAKGSAGGSGATDSVFVWAEASLRVVKQDRKEMQSGRWLNFRDEKGEIRREK